MGAESADSARERKMEVEESLTILRIGIGTLKMKVKVQGKLARTAGDDRK
jgi:hypothetical protein